MDALFQLADDLGPLKIVHLHEPRVGLFAVVAIDNVAAGPAIGGVRLGPDVTAEEAFRLARAMTLKNAAAGLPHGGGKSVIVGDPHALSEGEKERLVRAFAVAIRDLVEYIPGPDMGTDEEAMALVHDEIGRAVGLPAEIGGIPLDLLGATGFGLAVAAEVAADHGGPALDGARVAVQGFGAVGRHAARFLVQRGARLVAVADSQGTLLDPGGLDVDALALLKAEGRPVVDLPGGRTAPPEAVLETSCDILIPAARPDVVHGGNVDRLDTRLVLQGANIPFTAEAERDLHQRGVLVLPDFIANAGGVICAAVEWAGGTRQGAYDAIDEKIRTNVTAVLEQSARSGRSPREVAERMAGDRVRRAMGWRRWGREGAALTAGRELDL